MTLMFDSGMILLGEIRCESLLGVKGLTSSSQAFGEASIECPSEIPVFLWFCFTSLIVIGQ